MWVEDCSLVTELGRSIVEHGLTVRQIRDVRKEIRDGPSVGDAVSQVTRKSGRTRGVGSVEPFQAKWLGRLIEGLDKAVSVLNKDIDDALIHEDETLRIFLVEKRRIMPRLVDDLCEERQKYLIHNQLSNTYMNRLIVHPENLVL